MTSGWLLQRTEQLFGDEQAVVGVVMSWQLQEQTDSRHPSGKLSTALPFLIPELGLMA